MLPDSQQSKKKESDCYLTLSYIVLYPPMSAMRENKVELCLEKPPLIFRYQHMICRASRDSGSHNINYGGVEENKVV